MKKYTFTIGFEGTDKRNKYTSTVIFKNIEFKDNGTAEKFLKILKELLKDIQKGYNSVKEIK